MRKALEFRSRYGLPCAAEKADYRIYLNIAEWGPNGDIRRRGRARFAFRKSARALTARESAELAAVLPNPVHRSRGRPALSARRGLRRST